MTSIENTIEFFTNNTFEIKHPYGDFTFKTGNPLICGGTLCLSIWELKGKISIDGTKWYDIEALNPNDTLFTHFFNESLINRYGWVHQDVYATLYEEVKKSVFKNFKIISLSNKKVPKDPIYSCKDISPMDRSLLMTLDHAKRELSDRFDVTEVTLTSEQIIVINLNDTRLPSIDLLEDVIPKPYEKILFDIEEEISYILRGINIHRFTIGKINK